MSMIEGITLHARAKAPAPKNPTAAPATVEVWDGSSGIDRRIGTQPVERINDPIAAEAARNAAKVNDFMRTEFDRNGWDDKGSPLRIVVHAPDVDGSPHMNNATWDVQAGKVYIGDGDGKKFAPLGGSLDVLTHETTHAIVDSEVNLRYSGQQGGINESWADVFGALADPDDWQIGEDVYTPGKPGDAIRDLEHPRYDNISMIPKGADVEVHDLSGIPSLAAVRVATSVGRHDMGQIWYRALTDHLDSRSGFAGAARATLDAATELYGPASKQLNAVRDAWKSVGVNPRWKGPQV